MPELGKIRRTGAALAAVVLVLIACAPAVARGEANTPRATVHVESTPMPRGTAAAAANMVWMGDHYFSPSALTVKVGATVTWRMLGQQEHDVWSLDGSFHSPTMGPGSVYTHTFTKAGTFKYICLPHHGDGMYGEITVVL